MVVGSSIGELAFPLTQAHVSARCGTNRVRAFALVFNAGPAIALGLSPLVAGALVAVWGMRAAFVFAAACTAVSIVFFTRLSATTEPEPAGAATAPRIATPSTYRETLADGRVRRVVVLQFATIFALALGTSFVPTFLADERGLAPSLITVLGGLAAAGSAVFGFAVARASGLQRAPLVGVAIAIVFVAAALAIFAGSGAFWLIGVAFVLRGGFFSAWALFVAAIGEIVDDRHRARSFATGEMLGGLAFSGAPMVAAQLYLIDPLFPLIGAAALLLLLVPVLLRTQRALHLRSASGVRALEPEPA